MRSMFRTTDMVLIAVMVGAAAVTYKFKHDAQDRLAEIRKVQAQIRYEEDTIELLKADWSLLTQPARLQKLTEIYGSELSLQPLEARQMVGLADIPLKPPKPAPDSMLADGNNVDKIKTGDVAR